MTKQKVIHPVNMSSWVWVLLMQQFESKSAGSICFLFSRVPGFDFDLRLLSMCNFARPLCVCASLPYIPKHSGRWMDYAKVPKWLYKLQCSDAPLRVISCLMPSVPRIVAPSQLDQTKVLTEKFCLLEFVFPVVSLHHTQTYTLLHEIETTSLPQCKSTPTVWLQSVGNLQNTPGDLSPCSDTCKWQVVCIACS